MTIISKILSEECKIFYENYVGLSRNIFERENNTLIHAGEFGRYREKLVHNLLSKFSPTYIQMSEGFIVNKYGDISTQCDIIGSDRDQCIIRNGANQMFFMSEAIHLIGEVKSKIKVKNLNEILRKMSVQREIAVKGNHAKHFYGIPLSFLVCEEIESSSAILDYLSEIYDQNPFYQPNMILSLKNGLFTYYMNFDGRDKTVHYPISKINERPNLLRIYDPNDSTYHIRFFAGYVMQHLSSCHRRQADIISYLSQSETEILDKKHRNC
jgi:hypothetical protein